MSGKPQRGAKRETVGPRAGATAADSIFCPACGKTWISCLGRGNSYAKWRCTCGWESGGKP